MHMTKRAALVAGAASVLALAGGGTAFAAGGSTALNDALAVVTGSPITSAGVISACYGPDADGSHVVLLQDSGTTCPKGTTPISWNQTGPAGPAGAIGATGPAGPAGSAGPAGAIRARRACRAGRSDWACRAGRSDWACRAGRSDWACRADRTGAGHLGGIAQRLR